MLGVPLTWKPAVPLSESLVEVLVEHDVGRVGLEQSCRQQASLLDQFAGRVPHRRTSVLQRTRTHRAAALGHQVGIAPYDVDLVHGDAGLLAGEHAPRGDVTLAVGGGAGVHDRPTVVEHFDPGVLPEGCHAAGDLDIGADTDAQLLHRRAIRPTRPAGGLLGAQLGVAGGGQHPVESAFIVADVVGLADCSRVLVEELGDQVLAAQLCRVHAQFGSEEVHRSLGGGGSLGPAGPAIGGDDRSVGDHARGAALDVGDGVDGTGHRAGHEGGEDGAHLGERPAVLDDVELIVGDGAVAPAADGDVLHLAATVTEDHHRLAAGLAPAEGPTHLGGDDAQ